jgi:hypothetical protein
LGIFLYLRIFYFVFLNIIIIIIFIFLKSSPKTTPHPPSNTHIEDICNNEESSFGAKFCAKKGAPVRALFLGPWANKEGNLEENQFSSTSRRVLEPKSPQVSYKTTKQK